MHVSYNEWSLIIISFEIRVIKLNILFYFRQYENIIVIYRDPIFRAMSPSNNLKREISYNEAKFSDEYFKYHFVKDMCWNQTTLRAEESAK